MMEGLIRLILALVTGAVGFFFGMLLEKRRNSRRTAEKRTEDAIILVRQIAGDAHRYFIVNLNASERGMIYATVLANLKRLHINLHDLARQAKKSEADFLPSFKRVHSVITESPFGDETIKPLNSNDKRISEISAACANLECKIRNFEDHC